MCTKAKNTIHEFPKTFWALIFASFIDQIGGFLLFPFFALYITDHFGASMTNVGFIFTLFSVGSIGGNIIAGALTDKLGRRFMLLLGILTSGAGSVVMTFVNDIEIFYILAIILGLTGNLGGPAQQAIVADVLPPVKTSEGFAIMRIFANLAATIGPALGGLLAAISYNLLFYADGILSLITAILVYFIIPETKPEPKENEEKQSFGQTMKGYLTVLKDWVFMLFFGVNILVVLVYMQMQSTLSVYLRDFHEFPPLFYGYLISMNALMVVIFQFPLSRLISKYKPMRMMALGVLLYGVGFVVYGVTSNWYLFFVAMGVITIGEMVTAPFSQSAVARFAPEDKRGRYMAVFGFSWIIPNMFGILVVGIIMDHYNPSIIWYSAGVIAVLAMAGFLSLEKVTEKRFHLPELDSEGKNNG